MIIECWSCAAVVVGGKGTVALPRDFAQEVADYLQNTSSTKRIPLPTIDQESAYLSIAMSNAQAAADRALQSKLEADKIVSAAADRVLDRALQSKLEADKLVSAAADRVLDRALQSKLEADKLALQSKLEADKLVGVYRVGFLATAGFVAGSMIVSRFGFGHFGEIARALRDFLNMVEGKSIWSLIFVPLRRKGISSEGERKSKSKDEGEAKTQLRTLVRRQC